MGRGGERYGSLARAGDKLPAFLGMKEMTWEGGCAAIPSRQDPPGRAALQLGGALGHSIALW